MPKSSNAEEKIIKFLSKQEWPCTTEDIAKGIGVVWQTAQINLFKLAHAGKIKYRKVGRQNQWWLDSKYRKEMG